MGRLVIVGASLAGLRAAQGARAASWDGEIVVIGEEQHMPYTRPPLSKGFLTTPTEGVERQLFRPVPEATWLLGERARRLDPAARRLTLDSGEELAYDRLVIATGCQPRRWGGPGAELAGVHVLRDVAEGMALRDALAGRSRLVIVGAGFIGCEVAASARALGLEVTLVDLAPAPMGALGPVIGKRCAELHRSHNVCLRLGNGVAMLCGDGRRVRAVELTNGARIEADVVLIALGAVPNTDWLVRSGLALNPGVCCDATLTVQGDHDVLAAGDVAAWPHVLAGGGLIRVEHWTNAAEQGLLAGRNSTRPYAERSVYDAVPSFWSDQFDVRFQAVGLPGMGRHWYLTEASADGWRLVAVAEREGMMVAAVAVNGGRRMPWYRGRIGRALDVDRIRAAVAEDAGALGDPGDLAGAAWRDIQPINV